MKIKAPIAKPLTVSQVKKWLKKGSVIAVYVKLNSSWHINIVRHSDILCNIPRWIKGYGDRVFLLKR